MNSVRNTFRRHEQPQSPSDLFSWRHPPLNTDRIEQSIGLLELQRLRRRLLTCELESGLSAIPQ
jgi:hypothetical protein